MENNFYLLTPEYWAELEKREPGVLAEFRAWLVDYKMRIGWNKIFADGVGFYDLPADLQHGILSRFYFEAGELHNELAKAHAQWIPHTRFMFESCARRLKELDNIKHGTK